MSLVKVENISTGYDKENIIDNISFEINEGELVGLLGTNACGKSTLIKSVCNILPHSGKVTISNNVVEELKTSSVAKLISYVPQQSGLGIDISLLDVVLMGFNPRLKLLERPDNNMISKAKEIITNLGLEDKLNANYMTLSEGQKQLAILARALVSNGSLLVMDEPESALDFSVRYKIIKNIKKWISDGNKAGLIILHDVMLALNYCDKLLLLNDKRIVDIINLHYDSIEDIEMKLREIYGDISLFNVKDKSGINHLVMLFDSEAI